MSHSEMWQFLPSHNVRAQTKLIHYRLTATIVTVKSKFYCQKREGIKENISYERHVYESVDDESLS